MAEQIKNGGPAFPSPEWSDAHGNISPQEYGMTLRDYFAAKAMQSLILNFGEVAMQTGQKVSHADTAKVAYSYAKAMLAARGDA